MSKLYKRVNLGRKPKPVKEVEVKKPSIIYPTFYVNGIKLPLGGKDVGKTFDIVAKIKLVGVNERTSENKNDLNYDFEIQSMQL